MAQALVDPVDELVTRLPKGIGNPVEGGRGGPGPERGEDRAEAACIQWFLLLVCKSRSAGGTRGGGSSGIPHGECSDQDPEQEETGHGGHPANPAL
jgi:hypothetical protein